MKLTSKEMEIMVVLWDNEHPMTANEIIETSSTRTWKENSIYIIMNTLIKKGAVILAHYKPTSTNNARAYTPAITSSEYMVRYIETAVKAGVSINTNELIKGIKSIEKG